MKILFNFFRFAAAAQVSGWYGQAKAVYAAIGTVFAALLLYKKVYPLIGLFFTRKFKPAKQHHRYGIVIAARNEETVIGNLLDSIEKQDYPKERITVFVVADNCTDATAQIARAHGAVCYERFDPEHKTKGYALQFLFDRIEEDYGRSSFEGYFVFDADNLLKRDYISRMNDAFDAGAKIITSYRNTKNFDESWVASTYAIHWLRSARVNHRTRSFLRLATNIQGTGFLFSNEIVKDGWKYTSLTEDRALTVDAVAQGYQITYNHDAEFYDEQPVDIRTSLRQRLRWAKGHLQAFAETGPYLLLNIFFGRRFLKTRWQEKAERKKGGKTARERWSALLESIRHRAASYDTLMQLTPFSLLNGIRWLVVSVLLYGIYCFGSGLEPADVFRGNAWLIRLLHFFFPFRFGALEPGWTAFFCGMLTAVWFRFLYRVGQYLKNIWTAVYIFIVERRRIKKIPLHKKLLYIFTFPTFDSIMRYERIVALFKKVTWKPIPHESRITIEDLQQGKEPEKQENFTEKR